MRLRSNRGWLVAACLWASAVAWADEADSLAAKVADARAKVAAKDYAGAFGVYQEVFRAATKEKDADHAVLAEAVPVAMQAKKLGDALRWAQWAVHKAPEPFASSEKAKETEALIPKIEEAIRRKKIEDHAFAAGCVAAAIKALSHGQDLLKFDWLEKQPPDPEHPERNVPMKGELSPYRVRDGLFEDILLFYGSVIPSADGKHVRVAFHEWFEDKAGAEARMQAIAAQFREQKGAWERQFKWRTAKDKYELHEMSDVKYRDQSDPDMTYRTDVLSLAWNAGTSLTAGRTWVAMIELEMPAESRSDPKKNGLFWQVHTRLDSYWFK